MWSKHGTIAINIIAVKKTLKTVGGCSYIIGCDITVFVTMGDLNDMYHTLLILEFKCRLTGRLTVVNGVTRNQTALVAT